MVFIAARDCGYRTVAIPHRIPLKCIRKLLLGRIKLMSASSTNGAHLAFT
jgi:hypothetical protein